MKLFLLAAVAAILSACASAPPPRAQDAFFASLRDHCGGAYAGGLVTTDPADADIADKALLMEVRRCAGDTIEIPFHVGEDRSRIWIITRTAGGLRLKHVHTHEDGEPDVLTMYGGDTVLGGSETRQEFPADQFSKDLFVREGRPASVDNVWAIEIGADRYVYELRRPNRHFRVEFDLTKPVQNPPQPWRDEADIAQRCADAVACLWQQGSE
jgi:hypothetical protein